MSKFPKRRWDKITTNLAESFNAWLRNERHHSTCSFIIEHMTKLGAMLVQHKAESNAWKGIIGLKIEEKVKINIAKGEVYSVSPFMETFYAVFVGDFVTPRFPARPEWQIRTESGTQDHIYILGLFT